MARKNKADMVNPARISKRSTLLTVIFAVISIIWLSPLFIVVFRIIAVDHGRLGTSDRAVLFDVCMVHYQST